MLLIKKQTDPISLPFVPCKRQIASNFSRSSLLHPSKGTKLTKAKPTERKVPKPLNFQPVRTHRYLEQEKEEYSLNFRLKDLL
jgi:hypothetical protein